MIRALTCSCGRVFHCGPPKPGQSRGVCAACRAPVTEAMELAAVVLR